MNVGIVTATYAPSRNGVATSTALFVRGLRRLGHRGPRLRSGTPGGGPGGRRPSAAGPALGRHARLPAPAAGRPVRQPSASARRPRRAPHDAPVRGRARRARVGASPRRAAGLHGAHAVPRVRPLRADPRRGHRVGHQAPRRRLRAGGGRRVGPRGRVGRRAPRLRVRGADRADGEPGRPRAATPARRTPTSARASGSLPTHRCSSTSAGWRPRRAWTRCSGRSRPHGASNRASTCGWSATAHRWRSSPPGTSPRSTGSVRSTTTRSPPSCGRRTCSSRRPPPRSSR